MKLCSVADCLCEVEAGDLCASHRWRSTHGKKVAAPLRRRQESKLDVLMEAALRVADVDAEDDGEFERARDALRKAAERYSPAVIGRRTREAMAAAKAQGRHVGRPAKVDPRQAAELLTQLGGVVAVARHLGVSRQAVWRALEVAKGTLSQPLPR